MAQQKKEENPAPQKQLLFHLVVEYDPQENFIAAAEELIEKAREMGNPVSAVLTGLPISIELKL